MCTLDAELGRQSGGPRDEGAVARHIAWCRVAGGVTEPLAVPRPRVCRRRAPRAFARVWHRWLTGLLLVAGLGVLAATPPMPIPRGATCASEEAPRTTKDDWSEVVPENRTGC